MSRSRSNKPEHKDEDNVDDDDDASDHKVKSPSKKRIKKSDHPVYFVMEVNFLAFANQ